MRKLDEKTARRCADHLVQHIPCRTQEEIQGYIDSLPESRRFWPRPEIRFEGFWFCARCYHDTISDARLLQVLIGSDEEGDEYMGYDRIDPCWLDAEGCDEGRWELTRAYVKPQFRGRNYSLFMTELVEALARRNRAESVVAFPRHVAMLVTLLDRGYETQDGSHDDTLHRILNEGRSWYAYDARQRQLYYSQEFRPFIQDGSFVMEKRVARFNLWRILTDDL